MRPAQVFLSLALVVSWLGSGMGPDARPQAAGDSTVQAAAPGRVSMGLTPLERQRIQDQVAKLTATDGVARDNFGGSVSVSGDTAVVGAVGSDVGQGAAYVFYRDQGGPDTWGQVAKLIAADGAAEDYFGCSVSVSGDTAVIGMYTADVGSNSNQGAAYVFYRNQGGPNAWGQVAKLTATDGATDDNFGHSVSVYGDTAVVGAPLANNGSDYDRGAAYVFYRNLGGTDAWGQAAKLTAADGMAYDSFGRSVSVSGDTAIVGAVPATVGGDPPRGGAYIFYRDQGGADAWGRVAKLTATDGVGGDKFGDSVSVSGDTAVVGAVWATVGGNKFQGAAYIFYRNRGGAGAWGQVAKLTAADGAADDVFGSVSVSGNTAIVGATGAAVGGAAYVFYRNLGGTDSWGQVAKLTAADGATGDSFGTSASVSGDIAVIGAQYAWVGDNPGQGAAYVYALPPVAADDAYVTPKDTTLQVPAALGVLANDIAPSGVPPTAVLGTGPGHGTLDLHIDGSFTYTPTVDYAGLDTFTYYASSGAADSNVATVWILVYAHTIYLTLVLSNG